MKTVFMCGGNASRLPMKWLREVDNRPLISYVADPFSGISDELIIISKFPEVAECVNGTYIKGDSSIGNGEKLLLAESCLGNSSFLAVLGDVVTDGDEIKRALNEFNDKQPDLLLTYSRKFSSRNKASLINDRIVFDGKDPKFSLLGVYLFNNTIDWFDLIRRHRKGEYMLIDLSRDAVKEGLNVGGFPLDSYWDINTLDDLNSFARHIL